MYENLSIIVPVYNEEQAIGKVLTGLYNTFPDAEIIVVDDGSNDQSVNRIDTGKCKLIRHRTNKGYGTSLKTGVQNSQNDIIAFFDGDGQFDPDDLKKMVNSFEENNFHAIFGKRIPSSHKILSRSLGKLFLKWIANYLTQKKIPDLNCGMRVLKRDLFFRYMHIFPNGFSLSTTTTFVFLIRGYDVDFFPVKANKRKGTSSVRFFKDGFSTMLLIVRLIAMFDPLRVFLPVSLCLIFFSLCYSMWEAILRGLGVPVLGSVLGIGGLLIFFMGILCDQVSAIRLERYEPIEKNKK